MEVGLIVLGAALALVGGVVVDSLKTLRAGRAAALTIFTELSENENWLARWFTRAHEHLGLEPSERMPSGASVHSLSAEQLRAIAADRLLGDLRPFPRQVRTGWESQAVTFGQVASPIEMMLVSMFYIHATGAPAG